MWTIFKPLLSPDWYMPHGNCYLWQTPLVGLHVISNSLIAIAYFSIPAFLIYFLKKRGDVPFSGVFALFGAFIILCGAGHLLDVWTLWHPAYWLSGVERAVTAVVSCYTAGSLMTLLPRFLSLRTPEELESINQKLQQEIQQHSQTEAALRNIIAGTSSVTGEAFFPVLVRHLACALDVPRVAIYELRKDLLDERRAIAIWHDGETFSRYENDNIQDIEETLDLDAYTFCLPLRDTAEHQIGVLCILHPQSGEPDTPDRGIVNVFAARAAAELERQRTEQALVIANAELEARVRDRTAELASTLDTAKHTQKLLRSIIDRVPGWIFAKDCNYRYILANESFSRALRKLPEEVVGHDDLSLGLPIERVFGNAKRHLRGLREDDRQVLSGHTIHRPDNVAYDETGTRHIFDTTKLPLYDDDGRLFAILGVSYEVTDRHNAQAELEHSQTQLQTAQRLAHIGSWEMRFPQGCTTISAEFQRILAWPEDRHFSLETLLEMTHPQDRHRVGQYFERALKQADPIELDYRILRPDGELRYLFVRTETICDDLGKAIRLVGTAMDITERKEAEVQLRESEHRERLKARLLERTLADLQRAQTQLVQREKMASLGQLVGGVAHEINNPTSFIQGNITYAEEYAQSLISAIDLYERQDLVPSDALEAQLEELDLAYIREDFPKLLDSMRTGVDRISHIVRSLRSFARLDESDLKTIDLHQSLDSTLTMLQSRLNPQAKRTAISVKKHYDEALPAIECYANSLNQVFLNTIGNAIDAIESRLQSGDRFSPQIELETRTLNTGQHICIILHDNGCGIPDDLQENLFDPFVTTKDVGYGTGLGLAITYQAIVQEHGGQLSCESQLHGGTTFYIEIPVRQTSATTNNTVAPTTTLRSSATPSDRASTQTEQS